MHAWNLAAVGCLIAGGLSVLVGEGALAQTRDLAALYWFATGAVSLRASLALARR